MMLVHVLCEGERSREFNEIFCDLQIPFDIYPSMTTNTSDIFQVTRKSESFYSTLDIPIFILRSLLLTFMLLILVEPLLSQCVTVVTYKYPKIIKNLHLAKLYIISSCLLHWSLACISNLFTTVLCLSQWHNV